MELKNELARKEQLIEKYHAKLTDWQRLVNDAGLGSGGGNPAGQRGGAQGTPAPQGPMGTFIWKKTNYKCYSKKKV